MQSRETIAPSLATGNKPPTGWSIPLDQTVRPILVTGKQLEGSREDITGETHRLLELATGSPLAIEKKAIHKLGSHHEETYELSDQTSRTALSTSAKQEEPKWRGSRTVRLCH